MNEAVVGLSLAYVALAVLVVLLLVYTRWPLWLKASVVLGVGVFYFVTYASLERVLGWPTAEPLPAEFIVLSGRVKEPVAHAEGDDGAIYLWIVAYDIEKQAVLDTPRAHKLPYSADLHKQVAAANKRRQRGNPQVGRVELVSGPRLRAPRTWVDQRVERITLYDFPRRELPEK